MPTLKLISQNVANPQTIDLSSYLDLTEDGGTDPAASQFTDKVFTRSLLKEGATLSLEQLTEKEQVFELLVSAANQSAMITAISQLDQVINTPGFVVSWQDDGLSQPTYFDGLSGQFDIQYSYRKTQRAYTRGKLRLFSQPLGHPAAARPYAAASAVGPLLMISPYASGGQLAIGASTQAGVAGYGGQQQGASSGVFYWGAPSLAGDAPALLQVSYVGPHPAGAPSGAAMPYAAVSLLPDQNYQPLITTSEFLLFGGIAHAADAVASQYYGLAPTFTTNTVTISIPTIASPVPLSWAGLHRVFAIARASNGGYELGFVPGVNLPYVVPASVYPGSWQLVDLGTLSLRPSQTLNVQPQITITVPASVAADVTALVMLPDNATCFFNPTAITPSGYGGPTNVIAGAVSISQAPYGNTVLIDDVLGDQFIYGGQQVFAPSPAGAVASAGRITPYTRGLVPHPDPKNGLPIVAILGMAQPFVGSSWFGASAAWANPQNLRTMAQVSILERCRYVLP